MPDTNNGVKEVNMTSEGANLTSTKSDLALDYKLKTPEERTIYVKELLSKLPPEKQTHKLIENLTNYILAALPRDRRILTDNRMVTIDKRETSFEGLSEKFETNTDAIYDLFTDNKNQFLVPKISITAEDLEKIPELRTVKETIDTLKTMYQSATGKRKYLLKKQIIEFCRDQYIIKQLHYQPPQVNAQRTFPNTAAPAFDETYSLSADGTAIETDGNMCLGNPDHVSLLLCNYSELKQSSYDAFNSDMYYLLQDLEDCIEAALPDAHPLYYEILILKIDGLSNAEIHDELLKKFGKTYTPEYISCVWRKKIPKLVADEAKQKYLNYYYTEKARGKWKKCSCCGQIKLAHPLYFSKNSTSKDGFYSLCKECRSKKQRRKSTEED